MGQHFTYSSFTLSHRTGHVEVVRVGSSKDLAKFLDNGLHVHELDMILQYDTWNDTSSLFYSTPFRDDI